MRKKLRILAGGDFHGSIETARRLSQKALEKQADLIVLTGDIAGAHNLDEKILEPFTQAKQKVVFVPGNWDDTKDILTLEEKARNIHGRYVIYEDVSLAGIGNKNWKLQLNQLDFYLLKHSFDKIKTPKRILVSHLHAQGTLAEFAGITGDPIIRKAVETFKPDILIASHIHQAEGLYDKIGNTKVFQVGRTGTLIEI